MMWSTLFGGVSAKASVDRFPNDQQPNNYRRKSAGSPASDETPSITALRVLRQQITTEYNTVALGTISPVSEDYQSEAEEAAHQPTSSHHDMSTRPTTDEDEGRPVSSVRRCLIVVDVQNDFVKPNGALVCQNAESFLPPIIQLMGKRFDLVVKSRDWHPEDHCSFEGCHPDLVRPDVPRWPRHCVRDTWGAEIVKELPSCVPLELLVSKGADPTCDSGSAFGDRTDIKWSLLRMRYGQNGEWTRTRRGHEDTGLARVLLDGRFDEVFVCGFALEVCVKKTALVAYQLGFSTFVVRDASGYLDPKSAEEAENELLQAGVEVIDLSRVADV